MVENIPKLHTPKPTLHSYASNADVSVPAEVRASMPARAENIDAPTAHIPNDSASFSSQKKEEGVVKRHWGKMLLGAAAIAASAVLTKGKLWAKPESLEKIQQSLAEIFGKKDLTKEQAAAMLKKYKELLKIEDKTEFINRAFNQVKEDFGYKDIEVKLLIYDKPIEKTNRTVVGGSSLLGIEVYKGAPKASILNTLAHEFTHTRQKEFQIRTNVERFLDTEADAVLKVAINSEEYKKAPKESPEELRAKLKEFLRLNLSGFEHLPKIKENTPEYELAEKYFKATKEYFDESGKTKDYKDNFLEKEAWHNGNLIDEVIRYISAMK